MQNTPTPNFFEFYGIPVALTVDATAVRRIYLEKSRTHHPDFHTQADNNIQADALHWATLNNEAFKTLSHPDLLLEYVLRLTNTISDGAKQSVLPQEFLFEMMDINEKIMSLEFDPDPTLYKSVLESVQNIENNLKNSVGSLLESWTADTHPAHDLESVKDYFLKRKYLLRIKENVTKFAPAFE
jgi:molecular chaperone HscB